MGCIISYCFLDCWNDHEDSNSVQNVLPTVPTQEQITKNEETDNVARNTSSGERLEDEGDDVVLEEFSPRSSNNEFEFNYKQDILEISDDKLCEISERAIPLKKRFRYVGQIAGFQRKKDCSLDPSETGFINNFTLYGWNFKVIDDKARFINIPFKSEEARIVVNLFSQSKTKTKLRITTISRIENRFLYAMYLFKREEMQCRYGHVDELNLFHGTKKQNVLSICNDNFDWRRYGDSVGNRFGKGVSFTPKATYAVHYCDEGPNKVMFLVKVLVSKAIVGNENMTIPVDLFHGKQRFYDTTVKENVDVVVKYGDNEFYPAYKIYFVIEK